MQLKKHISAAETLEYFNYFHDSFIKKFSVFSPNRFTKHKLSVMYDTVRVEVRFAHFNYAKGNRPFRQFIRAVFSGVDDLRFAILKGADATVMRVDITESADGRYIFKISYPDNTQNGKLATNALFTFQNAVFYETPCSEGFPPGGIQLQRPAGN